MTSGGSHATGAARLLGVTKRFTTADGTFTALTGIELELARGELVALVGRSGCGKSTLLRLVAGLELPTEGEVLLDGKPVTGPASDCAVVFQEHRLFPWLTVAQNVAFGVRGLEPAAERALVAEQLALMGLSGFEAAYPHQLSGGMAQRVALARALARRPAVLLLDEPFAALDAFTRLRLQEELSRIYEQTRLTCLLVTHDIEEAIFLADRVVVLSERPGSVRRQLSIDLPRPRDRTSSAFSLWRRQVLREFQAPDHTEPSRLGSRVTRNHRGLALAPRTKESS